MQVQLISPSPRVLSRYRLLGWMAFFLVGVCSGFLFTFDNVSFMRANWLMIGVAFSPIIFLVRPKSELAIRFSGGVAGLAVGAPLFYHLPKGDPVVVGMVAPVLVIGSVVIMAVRWWLGHPYRLGSMHTLKLGDQPSEEAIRADQKRRLWRLAFWIGFCFLGWSFLWVAMTGETLHRIHIGFYIDVGELSVLLIVIAVSGRRWPSVRNGATNLLGGSLGVVLSYLYFHYFDSSRSWGVRLMWLIVPPVVLWALVMRWLAHRQLRMILARERT